MRSEAKWGFIIRFSGKKQISTKYNLSKKTAVIFSKIIAVFTVFIGGVYLV